MKELLFKIFPPLKIYRLARRHAWQKEFNIELRRYLSSQKVPKLQIGAKDHALNGWFNTDIHGFYPQVFCLDATKAFPIKDETFDYAFSEHMIEHITFEQGLFMLGELFRVLKPGGKVRISTPNLRTLAQLYQEDKSEEQTAYIRAVVDRWLPQRNVYCEGFVINQLFGFNHRFIYDFDTLQYALNKAGFASVVEYRPGYSDDNILNGIDLHFSDYIHYESLVVEATKLR